jgi:hypothetical protein
VISIEDKVFRSLLPERVIDNLDAGVNTDLSGLFGLLAPFAIALTLPNDLVKKSTIILVS